MSGDIPSHLTLDNQRLLVHREQALREHIFDASAIIHWLRPCRVRLLMVVDYLDFSWNDFGLRTFVETLLTTGGNVRYEITLAHIFTPGAGAMMEDHPSIANRISQFKFDDAAHFASDKYDVVLLFGFSPSYFGRGAGYPNDGLSDAELQALAQFQNGGGGLFATGDHGALGKALCHKVARARNMRLWDSSSGDPDTDEVSMGGPRRNDTNRLGHDGSSQFNDQSDDVPQTVTPQMYTASDWIFRYSFPHPLLCGPNGVIRVLPDHPHEGECITPPDPDLSLNYTGPLGQEYPAAVGGGPRPLPEIVARLHVLAGTESSGKRPTQAHSFGGICAYDGHLAGVGRVVTDSTWHHFVNVNLIGERGAPVGDPKRQGFLATATGQAHLENIKAYFRNIPRWLARPGNISCMRSRLIWDLVYSHRVLESVLSTTHVRLADLHAHTIWLIGRHARDVLGRYAGQCQTRRLAIDIFPIEIVKQFPGIDPWEPRGPERERTDGVPWLDMNPLLEMALGGALVAVADQFSESEPKRIEKLADRDINQVAAKGAAAALERAMNSLGVNLGAGSSLAARGSGRRPPKSGA